MHTLLGLLPIVMNVVLPVFIIAGAGYSVRRWVALDPRPIARLSLYVFIPALLFNSLLTAQIGGDEVLRIGVFAVILMAGMVALGLGAGNLAGASRTESSALALAVAFPNTANYGLPVVLFAFGQEGFERAAVFVAFSTIIQFTLGLFVAARGRMPWRSALIGIFRMPVPWATLAAVLFRSLGWELPVPAMRAVTLVSTGAIPLVILLLGMQVAGMTAHRMRPPAIAAVAGRLVAAPLLALVLVALLQPTDLTARVLVLEAAMPTAVNAALLASEYDVEPDLVSSVTLSTTLLSLITVAGWVAYLQAL